MEIIPQVLVLEKKLYKAETNGPKMIKFGPNHAVTKTQENEENVLI